MNSNNPNPRLYYKFSEYLKDRFGCKIHRISVDGGFTCPNRDGTKGVGGCIYCNEKGSRASYVNPTLSITEQIQGAKARINKRFNVNQFIAYFQSYTNTYSDINNLQKLYTEALSIPEVIGIAIGTRPDCINHEILELLGSLGKSKYILLELGVQTLDDAALNFINRCHTAQESLNAIKLIKKHPHIDLLTHLIYGFPDIKVKKWVEEALTLCELGVNAFKFHHLHILKNTKLSLIHQNTPFTLTLEEYTEALIEVLSKIPENKVIDRLFGEASRNELISPEWTLHKSQNIQYLESEMIRRNIYQGKFYKS